MPFQVRFPPMTLEQWMKIHLAHAPDGMIPIRYVGDGNTILEIYECPCGALFNTREVVVR